MTGAWGLPSAWSGWPRPSMREREEARGVVGASLWSAARERMGEGDPSAIRLATLLRSHGCPVHLLAEGGIDEGRRYARALGLNKTFEVARPEARGSQGFLLWVEPGGTPDVVGGRAVNPGGPFGFVREEDLATFARAEAGAQR